MGMTHYVNGGKTIHALFGGSLHCHEGDHCVSLLP